MPTWFALVPAAVAMIAGAIAAVTSAGVGSLLTPALSLRIDIDDAVLAVTAPAPRLQCAALLVGANVDQREGLPPLRPHQRRRIARGRALPAHRVERPDHRYL